MSLLAATQITAIATVVLALGAIITAWFAIKAFGKQSKEVSLLQQQADRDIDQRRRAQAAQVFVECRPVATEIAGTMEEAMVRTGNDVPEPHIVKAHNASDLPIYKLAVIWTRSGGLGEPPYMTRSLIPAKDLQTLAPRLMPGETIAGRHTPSYAIPWVWLLFRDAAGVEWRTSEDGYLFEETKWRSGRLAGRPGPDGPVSDGQ
jgi:hypothetical protein